MNSLAQTFWHRYNERATFDDWLSESIRRRTADQLRDDYLHLEHRVEKLTLISRALFELLEEKHGLTEDEFMAKVKEIDLRDGREDGRLKQQPTDCPKCSRRLHPRNRHCIYCGFQNVHEDVFEG